MEFFIVLSKPASNFAANFSEIFMKFGKQALAKLEKKEYNEARNTGGTERPQLSGGFHPNSAA